MIIMDDFPTIKKEIDRLEREQERNKGAILQLKRTLNESFGKKVTIKLARKLFKRMRVKEHEYLTEYNRVKKAFLSKWGKRLKLDPKRK